MKKDIFFLPFLILTLATTAWCGGGSLTPPSPNGNAVYPISVSVGTNTAFSQVGIVSNKFGGNYIISITSQNGSVLLGASGDGAVYIGSDTVRSTFTAGTMIMGGITQSFGYNPVTGSTAPLHQPSIASATDVALATVTVTLKGGRPAILTYAVNTLNAAGGSRDYTTSIHEEGLLIDDEHVQTNSGTSNEVLTYIMLIPSTTAGTRQFSVNIRSSNATGTQTARDIHVTILEL